MMDTDLKQRQELCKDLEYLVTIDKSLREEIIDHFVYALNDYEVKEYEVLVGSILGEDWLCKLTLKAELSDHFW